MNIEELPDHVLRRIQVAPNGCWQWIGTRTHDGYGVIHRENQVQAIHRFVYQKLVGPIPAGLQLGHICHDMDATCVPSTCMHRSCCNPDHIRPMTAWENMQASPNYNGNKTHCKQGHSLDDAYIYPQANGRPRRACRTCAVARRRAA